MASLEGAGKSRAQFAVPVDKIDLYVYIKFGKSILLHMKFIDQRELFLRFLISLSPAITLF